MMFRFGRERIEDEKNEKEDNKAGDITAADCGDRDDG